MMDALTLSTEKFDYNSQLHDTTIRFVSLIRISWDFPPQHPAAILHWMLRGIVSVKGQQIHTMSATYTFTERER